MNKLTKLQINEYFSSNSYAMVRFMEAANDYVAARCLILNSLFSGYPLAAQAIEKLLKSLIFLHYRVGITDKTSEKDIRWFKPKKDWKHNPYELKEILMAGKKNLNKYDPILKKLHSHFRSRYFENKSAIHASSEELKIIDNLWADLVNLMNLPIEVKFRTSFFTHLIMDNTFYPTFKIWALTNNPRLQTEISSYLNFKNRKNEKGAEISGPF